MPGRSYVLWDDMVAAIVASLRVDLAVPMQVCNVGSGIGTSAGALAQKTLGIMARTVPVTRSDLHDRPRQMDIMELVADVSQSRAILGWQTGTSFEDGLRRTIDWFDAAGRRKRSEEHTSELQSLMSKSYAVFCLKKKNTHEKTKN